MQDTRDLTLFLLPRVKALMLGMENDCKDNIRAWLSKKGWLSKIVIGSLIDPVWKLIVGPMLPVIIKLAVDLAIGTIAPTLVPLIPLINKIIDYLSVEVLTEENKVQLKEVLNIVENFRANTQVKTALTLSYDEEMQIEASQEYFDSFDMV